ncbi:MAG: hypothetical protein SPL08_02935 [Pseudomonadota bacterium]|nr:hypothetical protein [Pseudomonadota bacterium]
MHTFKNLYHNRYNPSFVSAHLTQYLMAEIYAPAVIRLAYERQSDIPFYALDSIHPEIREIINLSPTLSDLELQQKINAHTVVRAIRVLVAYSHCPVPLTQHKNIPQRHKDFLSDRGKRALKILLHAATRGNFTHQMAELGIETTHKFLMDLGYYRDLINSGSADILTFHYYNKSLGTHNYYPPTIQLSQGCPNHCSHCFADAETKMSYMPYPMWRKIYEKLDMRYKYYHGMRYEYRASKWISWLPWVPKKLVWNFPDMDRFFHDSDPASYYDPIIRADSGDISLLLKEKDKPLYFLTKGVTDSISKRAIAKTALVYPIDISFVDTPKENKEHGIRQLQQTIELIRFVPLNNGIPRIWHCHLKSGGTVPKEIFMGETVIKSLICPSGRANQFPSNELAMNHPNDAYPFVINPNGDIALPICRNTQYFQGKLKNIFQSQNIKD